MDQRSLVGYSPRGRKEPDMSEQVSTKCKGLPRLSPVEQRNQMLCIYTAGYYPTIKKSEVLIHVTVWTKLKV